MPFRADHLPIPQFVVDLAKAPRGHLALAFAALCLGAAVFAALIGLTFVALVAGVASAPVGIFAYLRGRPSDHAAHAEAQQSNQPPRRN